MRAPRLLAPRLLALVAGAALLTGCGLEKPTPLVSVVSGGSFESSEAVYYCFEGQDPEASPDSEQGCWASEEESRPVIEATAGELIGVDVSKELSEEGWQVSLAADSQSDQEQLEGQRTPVLQDEHYFSFPAGFGQGNEPLRLTVTKVEEDGGPVRGAWEFLVVPRT